MSVFWAGSVVSRWTLILSASVLAGCVSSPVDGYLIPPTIPVQLAEDVPDVVAYLDTDEGVVKVRLTLLRGQWVVTDGPDPTDLVGAVERQGIRRLGGGE